MLRASQALEAMMIDLDNHLGQCVISCCSSEKGGWASVIFEMDGKRHALRFSTLVDNQDKQ